MAKRATESAFRFEEGLAALEAAVEALESGELGLEASIKKYEEGMALYRACVKRLDDAKRRIEKLLAAPDDGSPASTEPLDRAGGTDPAPAGEDLPF